MKLHWSCDWFVWSLYTIVIAPVRSHPSPADGIYSSSNKNQKCPRTLRWANTNNHPDDCPLGLLCRRPQIFDVRLSVRLCVRPCVRASRSVLTTFWTLKCAILLQNTQSSVKKWGKKEVTKCNLISMEIKVNKKWASWGDRDFDIFGYFRYDVGDVAVLRLSCAKALKGHLALH